MRRQDQWLLLADRLKANRAYVIACCVFLNQKRDPLWIAKELGTTEAFVDAVRMAAKPLLRQPRGRRHEVERCYYCGSDHDLSIDHVIPRSRGGTDDPRNKVWACMTCNAAKGNRTPTEWLTQENWGAP